MSFEDWPKELREKSGAWRTANGKCPLHAHGAMACMFCPYGHMTECHYPYTCDEAQCSHLAQYE